MKAKSRAEWINVALNQMRLAEISRSKKLRVLAAKFKSLYPKGYVVLGVLDGTKRTMMFGFLKPGGDLRSFKPSIDNVLTPYF